MKYDLAARGDGLDEARAVVRKNLARLDGSTWWEEGYNDGKSGRAKRTDIKNAKDKAEYDDGWSEGAAERGDSSRSDAGETKKIKAGKGGSVEVWNNNGIWEVTTGPAKGLRFTSEAVMINTISSMDLTVLKK